MSPPVLELARHELEVALRTRRVVLVAVLYLSAAILGGVGVALAFAKAEQVFVESVADTGTMTEEELRAQIDEHGDEMVAEALERMNADVARLSPALTGSLVAPVFFWCSLVFMPFLIILATFDTVASDLRARTLCYATLRVPRWAIVVSKGLAWWAMVAAIGTVSTFVVFVGASRVIDSLSLSAALASATRIAVGLLPFQAAWIAITLWCSAGTNRPMTALVRAFLVLIGLRVLTIPNALVGHGIDASGPWALLAHLRWLSPSTYHGGLWHAPDGPLALSMAAFVAFTLAFGAAAVATLRRRDL